MEEVQKVGGWFARHWWMLVVRGVFALLFGFAAFKWPGRTLATLVLLFGAYAIVDGIISFGQGLAEYGESKEWWVRLLSGIAGFIVGALTFTWPGLTGLALLYLIAWYAILKGIFEIAAVFALRRVLEKKWLLLLAGIAAIFFGVMMLFNPGAGALAVVWLIGIYATVYGVLLIVAGFQLHGFERSDLTHRHA
jgi:uncharacterized membrane protein HdeD (DUF308 family)